MLATALLTASGLCSVSGLDLRTSDVCRPWNCTCQGMSDVYLVSHGKAWGTIDKKDSVARQWWVDHHCRTAPRKTHTHIPQVNIHELEGDPPRMAHGFIMDPHPHKRFDLKNYKNIYFHHMRKAGGTTVRKFLNQVARAHGIHHTSREGSSFNMASFDVELGGLNLSKTLLVTTLRKPVSRIWSSYMFEGAWRQMQGYRKPPRSINNYQHFDHYCNTKATIFKASLKSNRTNFEKYGRGQFTWNCCSECYHKWLGAYSMDVARTPRLKSWVNLSTTEEHHMNAVETLKLFDLILIVERLGDPQYVRWVEHIFQMPNSSFKYIKPRPRPEEVKYSPRAEKMKSVLELTAEQRANLEEKNKYDTRLYAMFTTGSDGY